MPIFMYNKNALKRREEENARSSKNEGDAVKKLIVDGKYSKGKKIYPDVFVSLESNEKGEK